MLLVDDQCRVPAVQQINARLTIERLREPAEGFNEVLSVMPAIAL